MDMNIRTSLKAVKSDQSWQHAQATRPILHVNLSKSGLAIHIACVYDDYSHTQLPLMSKKYSGLHFAGIKASIYIQCVMIRMLQTLYYLIGSSRATCTLQNDCYKQEQ